MKLKSIIILSITTIGLLSLNACKEDEQIIGDDPIVQFSFDSPTSGAMFHNGDTVYVKGTISFATPMHGYEVTIVNTSQADTIVFYAHEHEDATSFAIDEKWVNNVDDHSNMRLDVVAHMDHMGTEETYSVNFHCHPKM